MRRSVRQQRLQPNEAKEVQQVLIEITPVVGTARVASAGSKIVRALGLAVAVSDGELEEQGGYGQE